MNKFDKIFSKYEQSTIARSFLDDASNVQTRVDKGRRIVEVYANFSKLVPKDVLYQIENDMCKIYELNFIRIIPRYPSELFSKTYMPEIMRELMRVGAVSRGFFNDYVCKIAGDEITIEIQFNNGGVELLYSAHTNDIISNIIYGEFGIRYKVTILHDEYSCQTTSFFDAEIANLEKQARTAQIEHSKAYAKQNLPAEAPEAPKAKRYANKMVIFII